MPTPELEDIEWRFTADGVNNAGTSYYNSTSGSSSHSWTVPANVSHITILGISGGGGGETVLILETIVLSLSKSVGVVVLLLLNGWSIVGTLVKLLSLRMVEVAAVAAVAKSVTVVSAGSGSTTGVQTFDFSRPAVGGVFNIEFNSVTKWFDWNATVAQVQAAFGSDYAVTGNDGGPWTIEKVANGAVATGDMDVSKLDALDGWQATVKMNTPAMVQYMLDQTETEVIQYLEVQAGTAAAPLTVYQDEVTVTKDVINQ